MNEQLTHMSWEIMLNRLKSAASGGQKKKLIEYFTQNFITSKVDCNKGLCSSFSMSEMVVK